MSFDSFEAFIHMGGHGLFVWSAYGITLVVLAFNFLQPIFQRRKILSAQKRVMERESAREAA